MTMDTHPSEEILISLTNRYIVQSLLELALAVVLERRHGSSSNEIESPSPKGALLQVWLKLVKLIIQKNIPNSQICKCPPFPPTI